MENISKKQAIVDLIISYESQLEFSSALHPKNATDQKKAFLAEEIENPTFEYHKVNVPKIHFPELDASEPLSDLYQERMQHMVFLAQLLEAIGDGKKFTAISNQVFPLYELDEKVAVEYIQQLPQKTDTLLTAKDAKQAFERELQQLSLNDWTVEILPDISSRMFVNQWKKLVGVRADIQLTPEELNALTWHEIGVHVLRAANGQKHKEPLFHVGTRKGRLFEEGVACYVENPQGPARIFLRHHAVQLAQTSSFRTVWQNLVEKGVSVEEAWNMTLRVKRGLSGASQPGGFTRDAVYAQAFLEMKEYMEQGGDIAPLLAAPIHPDEIQLV